MRKNSNDVTNANYRFLIRRNICLKFLYYKDHDFILLSGASWSSSCETVLFFLTVNGKSLYEFGDYWLAASFQNHYSILFSFILSQTQYNSELNKEKRLKAMKGKNKKKIGYQIFVKKIFRLYYKYIFQFIFLFHMYHVIKSAKIIISSNILSKQWFIWVSFFLVLESVFRFLPPFSPFNKNLKTLKFKKKL